MVLKYVYVGKQHILIYYYSFLLRSKLKAQLKMRHLSVFCIYEYMASLDNIKKFNNSVYTYFLRYKVFNFIGQNEK